MTQKMLQFCFLHFLLNVWIWKEKNKSLFENLLKALCKKWMKAVNWFVVYYRLTYDPCLVSQNCLASFTIGRTHCELHYFHSLRTFYKSSWSFSTCKVSWQNVIENFSANVPIYYVSRFCRYKLEDTKDKGTWNMCFGNTFSWQDILLQSCQIQCRLSKKATQFDKISQLTCNKAVKSDLAYLPTYLKIWRHM